MAQRVIPYRSLQVSPLAPDPPSGFFPTEIEQWLFDNFKTLQRAAVIAGTTSEVKEVTNTVVETELLQVDIAANDLFLGETFEIRITGAYSNDSASDDFTLRVYLDEVLIHTISRVGGNVTDVGFDLRFLATVIAEGSAGELAGTSILFDNTNVLTESDVTPHSLDTSATHKLEFTFQWDNAKAGNTMKSFQAYVLTFNPVSEC